MLSFLAKATFAGLMVALVTVVAKRYPGWGGLLAALPITSLLAMSLLFVDTRDAEKVSQLSTSILAFIVPSIPLFIALPMLLRAGVNYWLALAIVMAGTMALFAASFWVLPRLGVKL
jgi:hypothetical protein